MSDSDKVLLITGASSGIGKATAEHAAQTGYRLVLAARSRDKIDRLADQLGGPDRAIAVGCDVTQRDQQEAMVQQALAHFGQVDAVFANAGIGSGPGGFSGADPDDWRDLLLTNVYGVALTLRVSLDALKRSRGHVLLTGSVAGRITLAGSMYSASKWAVTAIGYGLREELRGAGVRVTLIEPGMVDTPFFDDPKPDALKPNDVARAVIYALQQPHHVDVNEILLRPLA